MKLSWRTELPQLVIIAAMFAVAAWAWPQVPDRLPVHWNIRGEVDGWGNKFTGLLLLPITVLGVYALMLVVPFFDPGRRNYQNFSRAYAAIRITFVLFMTLLFGLTIRAAFGHTFNMSTIIWPACGLLFIVLGNFMSKIRPNWFCGVRTPWTLSSKLSWDKTHRLAGWLFMFMGALFFIMLLTPNMWALLTVLVIDGLCLVWIVVYSYLVYRDDPHRMPPAGTSPTSD
jgi:uncharacterized membrane protein